MAVGGNQGDSQRTFTGLQTVRTAFYEGYHDQKTCLSDSGGERGSGVCERNES